MSKIVTLGTNGHYTRAGKGTSLIDFPENFTVIDLETSGLDPDFDEVIEFSALRVRDSVVVDSFSSLVKPYNEIDEFITELTGITNEMLADAPKPEDVIPIVRDFISDDVVVGHNVNFDVNFLYEWFMYDLGIPFSNNFIDTLRISRKVLPDLYHHRLIDIAEALNVTPNGAHRALTDCQTTLSCFQELRKIVVAQIGEDDIANRFFDHYYSKGFNAKNITTNNTEFDETHPLFGKYCAFTGTLEKMTRAEAAQAVVDIGGLCCNNVNKKTNFLILGNTDYRRTGGDKSIKHKKAEDYKLSGYDIEILSENVFYDLLKY